MADARECLAVKRMSSSLPGLNSGGKAFQMPQQDLPTSLRSAPASENRTARPACGARESAKPAPNKGLKQQEHADPGFGDWNRNQGVVRAGSFCARHGGGICPRPRSLACTWLSPVPLHTAFSLRASVPAVPSLTGTPVT